MRAVLAIRNCGWLRTMALGLLCVFPVLTQADAAAPLTQSDAESHCRKYAARLGSVYPSDCDDRLFYFSGHHSVQGEPILLRDFPAQQGDAPRILVVGGIHGDELSSISIVFAWIRELKAISQQSFHWRITPSMNPDGLLRRKAQRGNANGVDLNRNFPTPNWEQESREYWVERTHRNPRRYPGPEPLSEPESRWLHAEIEQFNPDVIVAVHAPYGIVDFDGPSIPPNKLGHLYLNLLGTYPGSLGNYAGVVRGIPVVTVELPSAGIMPSARQQRKIWQDLLHWLDDKIDRPVERAAKDTP